MGKKKPKSKPPKPESVQESTLSDMDLIAAAICSATQGVFIKVCRLCESKDGPFLNIFDADKVTAKKIDELMPFRIAENDDLPHKICFRCSAKVEELYEFIQKCIKTQQSLCTALGKKEPLQMKSKTRAIWEEKLNKSNISNDDICDALIKKAMEGIKNIPLNQGVLDDEEALSSQKKDTKPRTESVLTKKDLKVDTEIDDDTSLKQIKLTSEKFIPKRSSRSQQVDGLLDGLPDSKRNVKKTTKKNDDLKHEQESKATIPPHSKIKKKIVQILSSGDESSSNNENEPITVPLKPKEQAVPKPVEPSKPFDIMDHVSTIKVNGVGVLFQCKLCNRNFLKKDVVLSHGCSKSGGAPKLEVQPIIKSTVQPEPPKAPVIKYINTKIDGELGKPVDYKTASEKIDVEKVPEKKPKPKIGPASKVKRNEKNPIIGMTVAPMETQETPAPPPVNPPSTASASLQFPSIPSLNSRYKLVPGPNNTFQLVEESPTNESVTKTSDDATPKSKKRKIDVPTKSANTKSRKQGGSSQGSKTEIVEVEKPPSDKPINEPEDQPYPVGLFSTLPHHSDIYQSPAVPEPKFTTPAMKKQSYTIVQTGNPSKLLISTKPQLPVDEVKKRQRKPKHDAREDPDEKKQPFNVTLEDNVRPKDSFFTFINVDPLLQPSYVLPTDNIIQESQISTSTPASTGNTNKYSCNMCNEKFSREKKLLAHIHSHYNKMDEEDMLREKKNKKRGRN